MAQFGGNGSFTGVTGSVSSPGNFTGVGGTTGTSSGKMEIWLKTNTAEIRLPVLPSSFNIETAASIDSSQVIGRGEISIFSGVNLINAKITSFFPATEYRFCNYTGFHKPYEFVKIIETWRQTGQQVRLIITTTLINIPMIIESFDYGESAGTRDVNYTLSLKEHKSPTLIYTVPNTGSGGSSGGSTATRPDPPKPNTQKTHKVKKGDCLWDIAHKYYGKGSRYPEIKKANQSKYPSLKKNNIIYVNWVLVIP